MRKRENIDFENLVVSNAPISYKLMVIRDSISSVINESVFYV